MSSATFMHVCFWASAAGVLYTYVLYPALIGLLARFRSRPTCTGDCPDLPVSVVLAAHNEEATIGRRVRELTTMLRALPVKGEIIVITDGCTDHTAEVARAVPDAPVHVVELPTNCGKAAALNEGYRIARGAVLILADARQTWAADAMLRLLENFSDPALGAVSGELVLESRPGVMAGVGLYWRFEKWLRRQESRIHSTVGVTGAISAVRRELFSCIPSGTILDDVYWPLCVAMKGYRVIHEQRAIAYDRLPERPCDEFRRKVRTLSANFQLVTRLPAALRPWRNPVWFQFISHKLGRLVVPWLLILMLLTSSLLPDTLYLAAFCAQVAFYLAGLIGMCSAKGSRLRIASAAGSFLVLNSAAWLGFWVWALGRSGRSWKKVAYTLPTGVPAPRLVPSPGTPGEG